MYKDLALKYIQLQCTFLATAHPCGVCAGYVCCNYIPGTGDCQTNAAFRLVAWVSTLGYWNFPGNLNPNDGAVLLVEPYTPNTVAPIPIGISTFNTMQVPPLVLRATSYPCGNNAGNTQETCQLNVLGQFGFFPCPIGGTVATVCFAGNDFLKSQCCLCRATTLPTTISRCASLPTTDCDQPYEWVSPQLQPQSPIPNIFGYFPPVNTGQVLTYVAPSCQGDQGAPLINRYANSLFAVLIFGDDACNRAGATGYTSYAQFVDRGQQDGIWVGALASRLIGQAPFGVGKGG